VTSQPRSRIYRTTSGLITLLVSLLLGGCNTAPGVDVTLPKRAVTTYVGRYSDNSLPDQILISGKLAFASSEMTAVAYSQTFHRFWDSAQWEWEAQVAKHWGAQTHWEFNALVVLRWMRFPWSKYIRTSAAIGDGLSYATEVPAMELQSHTNEGATQLLNYILIELAAGLPSVPALDAVFRIHHRSGAYGTFDGVDGGSNVLSIGLKFRF
jgi:hypothetical protein